MARRERRAANRAAFYAATVMLIVKWPIALVYVALVWLGTGFIVSVFNVSRAYWPSKRRGEQ